MTMAGGGSSALASALLRWVHDKRRIMCGCCRSRLPQARLNSRAIKVIAFDAGSLVVGPGDDGDFVDAGLCCERIDLCGHLGARANEGAGPVAGQPRKIFVGIGMLGEGRGIFERQEFSAIPI